MATVTTPAPRSTAIISKRTGRRIGYVVAILLNLALLFLVNVWPGWEAVPFVTPDAASVVPLVNASIIVSALANVVFIVADGVRIKALGDLITNAAALVATFALLDVFPFDFTPYAFPWEMLTRVILIIAVVGTAIAMVVNVVRLIRGPQATTASDA